MNATSGTGQIIMEMKLRGEAIRVLIDSGAIGNFISEKVMARLNIPIRGIEPFTLSGVNGDNVRKDKGQITQGTVPSKLVTPNGHTSDKQFAIIPTGKHEAILGMS